MNIMSEEAKSLNFIEHIIEEDLRAGFSKEKLRFRFPRSLMGIFILVMLVLYV